MNHVFLRFCVLCALLLSVCSAARGQGAQPITVVADSEVCLDTGGNVAMVNDLGSGATYNWTVTGGTIQDGQGTRMITYSVGEAASATISVDAMAGGTEYQGSAVVQ